MPPFFVEEGWKIVGIAKTGKYIASLNGYCLAVNKINRGKTGGGFALGEDGGIKYGITKTGGEFSKDI